LSFFFPTFEKPTIGKSGAKVWFLLRLNLFQRLIGTKLAFFHPEGITETSQKKGDKLFLLENNLFMNFLIPSNRQFHLVRQDI
jgi:hypothetical protein